MPDSTLRRLSKLPTIRVASVCLILAFIAYLATLALGGSSSDKTTGAKTGGLTPARTSSAASHSSSPALPAPDVPSHADAVAIVKSKYSQVSWMDLAQSDLDAIGQTPADLLSDLTDFAYLAYTQRDPAALSALFANASDPSCHMFSIYAAQLPAPGTAINPAGVGYFDIHNIDLKYEGADPNDSSEAEFNAFLTDTSGQATEYTFDMAYRDGFWSVVKAMNIPDC